MVFTGLIWFKPRLVETGFCW